jgi:2-polyprenyl-3-methyl-5-hydroxy-6-metoxy-1,4-benzoquinol methylase
MPHLKNLIHYNQKYFQLAHGAKKIDKISNSFLNAIGLCRIQYINNFAAYNNITINSVLEIGPGNGHLAKNLIKKIKIITYDTIETDNSLYENLKTIGLKVFDKFESLKNNNYDLIIVSHVLEHIDNPDNFLQNIKKKLSKNGIVFLEVPCLDYLHKKIHEPHLFFYEKKTLQNIIEKNSFNLNAIDYYGLSIIKSTNIYFFRSFKYLITILLLKLNLSQILFFFLKNKRDYDFLDNYDSIMGNLFEMNYKKDHPAWWLRAIAKIK